jgi:hypothetical protein
MPWLPVRGYIEDGDRGKLMTVRDIITAKVTVSNQI